MLPVQAQILDNSQCKVFSDDPFFSTSFIRQNRIRRITGAVSTKAKNDQVRPANTEYIYEFDTAGNLVKRLETFVLPSGHKDTVVMIYLYDSRGHLITKRKTDGYGFYSYNYTWDEQGRLTSEMYCREENAGPSKEDFVLGRQYIIAKETYSYEDTEVGLKQKFYNNYDKLYQEKFYYRNALGYLISEETRLLISNKRAVTEYAYDNKGRPIQKNEHSSVLRQTDLEYKYEYDELGNVTKEEFYRNGVFTHRREAVYFPETLLLKAIIVFDIATEFMHIVRYDYQYWN
jgi:YD repeat-containing protein